MSCRSGLAATGRLSALRARAASHLRQRCVSDGTWRRPPAIAVAPSLPSALPLRQRAARSRGPAARSIHCECSPKGPLSDAGGRRGLLWSHAPP